MNEPSNSRHASAFRRALRVVGLVIVIAFHPAHAESAAQDRIPTILVERSGTAAPMAFDIQLLAPRSWADTKVRQAMIERAAGIARENGASCFFLERADLDRSARYIQLRSGHMTVSVSSSTQEWQRYWDLYRHALEGPGIHWPAGTKPRTGEPIVRASASISLCGADDIEKAGAFEVERIRAAHE